MSEPASWDRELNERLARNLYGRGLRNRDPGTDEAEECYLQQCRDAIKFSERDAPEDN